MTDTAPSLTAGDPPAVVAGSAKLNCSFFVVGVPAPQGSKRPIRNPHTGRLHTVESSAKVKPWREAVKHAALEEFDGAFSRPVYVSITFYLRRPKGHYRTGRNAHLLRESAPAYPAGKPDLDKLVRSTLDGLTGVLFADDSQVVALSAHKCYAKPEAHVGARICVWVAS